jgi:hypothetical protein
MKIVMTLMVRDEADIIAPMIDHHLSQGVDLIIATDNGSVDGTAEILEGYAAEGRVVLLHDPVHRKQQGVVVTQMARDAASKYGADWVLNADADEFWLPRLPGRTLHDVFSEIDPGIRSFLVNVIDMTGPPALVGTGLQRLVYQDLRTVEEMNAVGLHAHSTPNAVHVGDPNVSVVQGNHLVSIGSQGAPPPELEIEVLHFPWRSWDQFSRKVDNSGRAYLNSSGLKPSPNHHGMRDFHRLQDGTLYASYLFRHPTPEELTAGLATGSFALERRIADAIVSPVADAAVDAEQSTHERAFGKVISGLEFQIRNLNSGLSDKTELTIELSDRISVLTEEIASLTRQLAESAAASAHIQELYDALHNRKVVRAVDQVAEAISKHRPRR